MTELIYDPELFAPVRPIPSLNLFELEEIECVESTDEYRDEYYFFCKPIKKYAGGCPHCGSFNYYNHGNASDRYVHDVSMGLTKVALQVKVPRYKCNDCGKTFSYRFEDIDENGQFTERLRQQLMVRSMNEPFTELAAEYNVSVNKIKSIMVEYGKALDQARGPITAPRVLGIDEKHIVNKMRAIFVDIENGTLLEMKADNKRGTVISTIESMTDYDKNIEIVTMDMANAYRPVVYECLPHAKIVVDKFHVLQDLYRKTQETKTKVTAKLKKDIEEMPAGKEKDYKAELITKMGKNVYLFKFGTVKLAEKANRVSLMAELCETFPEVNTLRLLKEGLERLYDAGNREQAEELYLEWTKVADKADKELFASFKTMKRTMKNWHDEIFNYFDKGCSVTNAASEGINSVIGAINTKGRGYGYEVLRLKCLYNDKTKPEPKRFSKKVRVFDDLGGSIGFTDGTLHWHWETREYTVVPEGSSIQKLSKEINDIV